MSTTNNEFNSLIHPKIQNSGYVLISAVEESESGFHSVSFTIGMACTMGESDIMLLGESPETANDLANEVAKYHKMGINQEECLRFLRIDDKPLQFKKISKEAVSAIAPQAKAYYDQHAPNIGNPSMKWIGKEGQHYPLDYVIHEFKAKKSSSFSSSSEVH